MDSGRLPRWPRILFPILSVLIVTTVVTIALILVGSPAQERKRWADAVRVGDLQSIKGAADRYYAKNKRLPDSLNSLQTMDADLRIADPETRRPYQYRVLGAEEYELSAVFETDTILQAEEVASRSEHQGYLDKSLPFWRHSTGTQRFQLRVENNAL